MASSLIDWSVAERMARTLAPAQPDVSLAEAEAAVQQLRDLAELASGHVAELTQLDEPPVRAKTVVVDRAGWIATNVASMAAVMDPLTDKLLEKRPAGKVTTAIGSRATGAQAGALLSFLSSKVLGQFEFFAEPEGQLLLVAPNIVAAERALDVQSRDFRLWVCLHEVTHRVQFTAVPWLRSHMLSEIDALTNALDLDPAQVLERLRAAVGELGKAARGDGDASGLIATLASPEALVVMDRVTGLMSLVEGHAEYVMNAVDRSVIPSQQHIESKFAERRRKGSGRLDRLLRTLLGMDAKTRQYTQGSAFVRAVVDQVGLHNFNTIWTSSETLPTKAEITAPADWVARVHG